LNIFNLNISLIILLIFFFISISSIADDSCKIPKLQDPVVSGVPGLCKGKPVNALLSASTGEPDFSNVDDILQGERTLLPVDDLVVMNPRARTPSDPETGLILIQDFFFFTEDEQISELITPLAIGAAECAINGGSSNAGSFPYGAPSPQQTNSVRMFNLDRDLVVTYSILGSSSDCVDSGLVITTQDPMGMVSVPVFLPQGLYNELPFFLQSTVGDFNDDGYEDILMTRGGPDSGMFIITARDPNIPEMGLKLGPYTAFPKSQQAYSDMNAMSSPVIGDFNGDTITDVAWVGSRASDTSPYDIYFASICPGSTDEIPLCNGRSEFEILLNPLSSQTIPLDTFIDANAEFAYPASALAAGNFNQNPGTSSGDDLIIIYGQAGTVGFDINYYTFNNSMSPTLRDSIGGQGKIYNVYADSAQFDRTQPTEQAVMAVQAPGSCRLWVFNFDQQGMIQHVSDWVEGGSGTCSSIYQNPDRIALNGMTVGRFTGEVPQTAIDQDPQIAVYYSDYTTVGNGYNIRILEANPENNFIAEFVSSNGGTNSNLTSYFGEANPNRGGSFLRAGDLQGRSLELGAPSVARIPKFTQVNVIQGSPPMHGDYIQALNDSEPIVNNFSVIPETYNTVFYTETSSNTSSTTASTSSYTYSFMEGVEFNAKYIYSAEAKYILLPGDWAICMS
jgi:hypothetical protein